MKTRSGRASGDGIDLITKGSTSDATAVSSRFSSRLMASDIKATLVVVSRRFNDDDTLLSRRRIDGDRSRRRLMEADLKEPCIYQDSKQRLGNSKTRDRIINQTTTNDAPKTINIHTQKCRSLSQK